MGMKKRGKKVSQIKNYGEKERNQIKEKETRAKRKGWNERMKVDEKSYEFKNVGKMMKR